MTVSSTTTKNSYSGNTSTSAFSYTFKIFNEDDITVIIRTDSTGVETVKTKTTHYTVSGVGNSSGGTITFTSGNIPATGETVLLLRSTPLTQITDYTPNDPFPAESHEDALDRLTFIVQQLQEEVDRCIKSSRANTFTNPEFTASATDRANKVFSFDGSGDLAVTEIASIGSATIGISEDNLLQATSGIVDDDFLRVNGTKIEGRSATEMLSDLGAASVDDATALAIALG